MESLYMILRFGDGIDEWLHLSYIDQFVRWLLAFLYKKDSHRGVLADNSENSKQLNCQILLQFLRTWKTVDS